MQRTCISLSPKTNIMILNIYQASRSISWTDRISLARRTLQEALTQASEDAAIHAVLVFGNIRMPQELWRLVMLQSSIIQDTFPNISFLFASTEIAAHTDKMRDGDLAISLAKQDFCAVQTDCNVSSATNDSILLKWRFDRVSEESSLKRQRIEPRLGPAQENCAVRTMVSEAYDEEADWGGSDSESFPVQPTHSISDRSFEHKELQNICRLDQRWVACVSLIMSASLAIPKLQAVVSMLDARCVQSLTAISTEGFRILCQAGAAMFWEMPRQDNRGVFRPSGTVGPPLCARRMRSLESIRLLWHNLLVRRRLNRCEGPTNESFAIRCFKDLRTEFIKNLVGEQKRSSSSNRSSMFNAYLRNNYGHKFFVLALLQTGVFVDNESDVSSWRCEESNNAFSQWVSEICRCITMYSKSERDKRSRSRSGEHNCNVHDRGWTEYCHAMACHQYAQLTFQSQYYAQYNHL